jgi:hypothetical protein
MPRECFFFVFKNFLIFFFFFSPSDSVFNSFLPPHPTFSPLRLALGALDTAPRINSIKGAVLARVEEARSASQRLREKEELRRRAGEAAEKLAEERHKEHEARRREAARQGPEALAKFEEREKIKELKRRAPKMKMVKG